MWTYNYTDELYHHGILGMKWGVRRYQNKDGTLTLEGKRKINKNNTLLSFEKKMKYGKDYINFALKFKYNDQYLGYNKNRNRVMNDYMKKLTNDKQFISYVEKHKQTSKQWPKVIGKANETNKYNKNLSKYNKLAWERAKDIGKNYYNDYAEAMAKDVKYLKDNKREVAKDYLKNIKDENSYEEVIRRNINNYMWKNGNYQMLNRK